LKVGGGWSFFGDQTHHSRFSREKELAERGWGNNGTKKKNAKKIASKNKICKGEKEVGAHKSLIT